MAMSRTEPTVVNISEVIDHCRVGSVQVGLFTLCALCLIIDGFDVQAMGYVAPALAPDLGIPSAEMGRILGAANFGVLIGSLVFTMVGDKLGRRPVLIGATLFFAVLTLLTARARSAQELLILRFIAGIGMGSIIPNATALIGEYSPRRSRVTLMMNITVGFTAGAAIGGFIAAWLIPTFGWRSVFYFGGTVPLVIAALMFFWLPESLQFMVVRSRNLDKVSHWLKRIDPTLAVGPGTRYVAQEGSKGGVPFTHLLTEGRAPITLLLWLINFMNLLNLYFLAGWLPTVIRQEGYSTSAAVLVTTALQVGGTIGTFGFAWLIARYGFTLILTASFAIACLSIAAIGSQSILATAPLLTVVVFIAGWCVVGGQPGLNALAATYYPTYMRSTGVGWALGIGRIGAIVGPVLGGQLIAMQWPSERLFFAAATAALISSVAMFSMRWTLKPGEIK
jgi:AAHS family 4-hydroxybenzoate transporter-like MFS transporter